MKSAIDYYYSGPLQLESPMTKGSTLLVAALENEGVDRIYGIPGEENLDVVEAIRLPPSNWC